MMNVMYVSNEWVIQVKTIRTNAQSRKMDLIET